MMMGGWNIFPLYFERQESDPMREMFYIVLGYLSGSILFSKVAAQLLGLEDVAANSCDHNPGTFNAFQNGGFLCGLLTLCGDLLKGFLPVWLYLAGEGSEISHTAFAFVLAAPVIGHIFPVYFGFQGGKGIAASFGCLLGLLPETWPVAILACCFLFFTLVVRVSSNYYKTLLTYLCAGILVLILGKNTAITLGFSLIMAAVIFRLLASKEEKQPCKVEFLWMH